MEQDGVNKKISGSYHKEWGAVCKNGTFVGSKQHGVLAFKGIPYAKPPVDALRWKPPVPVEESSDVYEAVHFGKASIQTKTADEKASLCQQGEDCLYLNVWANCETQSRKRPVMVYIHGGSYGWGGTMDPLFCGENFVRAHKEVILVTIGYRLGILGFVDFSSVPGGEAYESSCNLGLLDQVQALRWIRENISAFGGDPENITIFGESAGGGSVSLLSVMPQAKGLFQRVIAQSGSVALTYSKEECQPFTEKLLECTGAETMEQLLKLSEQDLMKYNQKVKKYCNFPQRDGKILPEDLFAAYARGDAAHVDMLLGSNADEARFWIKKAGGIAGFRLQIPVLFENNEKRLSREDKKRVKQFFRVQHREKVWKITEFYNELMFRIPAIYQAEQQHKNGAKAYMYYWVYPNGNKGYGACHATELAYVFNNLLDNDLSGDNISIPLAKNVQQMWVNFAVSGDPSLPELSWPEYDEENRRVMVLGEECQVVDHLLEEQREAIAPLLSYHFTGSQVNLSYRVPQIYKIVTALAATVTGVVTLGKWLWKKRNRKGK